MASHPDEAGSAQKRQPVCMKPIIQLLAYRFGPDAAFEGRLVGALERMESGGTLRVLDVLFVGRDGQTGELLAAAVRSRHEGAVVAPLLGFRLDFAERRRLTERALRAYGRGEEPNPLRGLAATLPPGGGVAAVLVEHVWARALGDAVDQSSGSALLSEFVDATELTELTSRLAAAVAASDQPPQPA
jgi:hypothetical protein